MGRADFGVGSGETNQVWNLVGMFDCRFKNWGSVLSGYQLLDYHYDNGDNEFDLNAYDASQQGPLVGLNFYWQGMPLDLESTLTRTTIRMWEDLNSMVSQIFHELDLGGWAFADEKFNQIDQIYMGEQVRIFRFTGRHGLMEYPAIPLCDGEFFIFKFNSSIGRIDWLRYSCSCSTDKDMPRGGEHTRREVRQSLGVHQDTL